MSTDTTTTANENAAILGTDKPTAKAVAAKVIARAKAKAPATKPSTKDIDAKIDAALGHKSKPTAKAVARAEGSDARNWKAKPAAKAFTKYDDAFCAKVRAFVKGGKSFMAAKREFGCSAHWVARLVKGE